MSALNILSLDMDNPFKLGLDIFSKSRIQPYSLLRELLCIYFCKMGQNFRNKWNCLLSLSSVDLALLGLLINIPN